MKIDYQGGKKRQRAFKKLKVFLENPGLFCLLVLGERGTGKRFAIEKTFEEIRKGEKKILCSTNLSFKPSYEIPSEATKMDELLRYNEEKTLIIEDVEELTDQQQLLLFQALSTEDGTFGIEEKYSVRVVFTSSIDADLLREDGRYFYGAFWDRISQLIVKFPSYTDEPENITNDFVSTWLKMKFSEIEEYRHLSSIPRILQFDQFLGDQADKFEGGFRDLDKLACMYFNYRILHYGIEQKIDEHKEKQVVEELKNDFFGRAQLQVNSDHELSSFQITPGFEMDDLYAQFRIHVRKWAKKEYGTIVKAEQKLGLGKGTMKNWTEAKATSKRRAISAKKK